MPKLQADQLLSFGPYRLDPTSGQLWRGTLEVRLTPKALAVLRHLVQQPGQVASKEEFFRAVWADTVVSDAALTSCIQELRQALHDEARNPRYIETVHRRGYRFIGKVASSQYSVISRQQSGASSQQLVTDNWQLTTRLVGREPELARLHQWWAKARSGERQIVFVTGEPGIGKTTLVEAFLAQMAADENVWIARGQCIEHYGAGEAYLPILEALGRLCREPGRQRVRAILEQYAPTWLIQLPALLTGDELEALQRKTAGATQQRMLREFTEALEVLTAEQPLVLVLEDLHWSDSSTLEVLFFLARRREQTRLLVLGTYRPVEVLARAHPLKGVKQELQMHGQCQELALDFLSEAHVAEYLTQRFVPPSPASVGEGWGESLSPAVLGRLARLIHQRTDGNPLFMVNVVDYVVAQGLLVEGEGRWELKGGLEAVAGGVPENLQQLIERQIERLSPADQRVLEVASVAGGEFSAAAVAAGVATEGEEVEERCTELTRRELFLRASGTAEWPDRTVAARYGFRHAIYQEVLYDRIPAGRRQRLHQRIGEREEAAYGERAREIAAELAVHFEWGRDYRRAIQYLQQAGENASRRSAHREAMNLLTRGLELLKTLPDTPERAQQELRLQIALGGPLQATKGWAAPEVERAYTRARELCRQLGETPQLFRVLMGLAAVRLMRAELQIARELGEQCLSLAQHMHEPASLLQANELLGVTLLYLGELAPARAHLEQGIALHDSQKGRSLAFRGVLNPGVNCRSQVALALWLLGYPDQAIKRSHEALTLAKELSHSFSLALALLLVARLHRLRREGNAAQEQAEALMTLSAEHGFPDYVAWGTIERGWALAEQGQGEEGIAQICQGLARHVRRPAYLVILAAAYEKAGPAEEGLRVVAEALAMVDKTGERFYDPDLYRLKGTLTLQSKVPSPKSQVEKEAEECFLKAIEIARKQQAKSLELRAVMSLARLWQSQGKKAEARQMLAEIYGWFTEGFDTADLKEAKALLGELGEQ